MLSQLKIEHALEEHRKFKLACLPVAVLLVVEHGASHGSPPKTLTLTSTGPHDLITTR